MNRYIIKRGDYVYERSDSKKRNLLVFKVVGNDAFVYCMRRQDKFWRPLGSLKLTPIPWKGETYDNME